MEKKRIVLVSHNDQRGGAAIVTYRLMKTLQSLGHEADMLVFEKTGDDPHVHLLGSGTARKYRFLKERLGIFCRNGFSRRRLFKVSTGSTGMDIANHPLVVRADAIFLNWINQATVSLSEIARLGKLGKRIVWTMHDMWNMTGICHHAYSCGNYQEECGNCQYLGGMSGSGDLSHKIWRKKKDLYERTDIRFVAVSNWVKKCAQRSSLLRNRDVEVIHNAFPSELFPIESNRPLAEKFGGGKYKRVIAFGAAKLDDPVKGISYAIDALNHLHDEGSEEIQGAVAVFFGQMVDPNLFSELRFPHVACGTITSQAELHNLLVHSDVILSTSMYETLGGTLIEGMSSGAVPVSFGEGGQVDIIDHKETGYIAEYCNSRDVAEGIKWALRADIDRRRQHAVVSERFDAVAIAKRYLELVED